MAIFRSTYKKLSDEDLVAQLAIKSSDKVLAELYKRYGHLVFGTSLKYLNNKEDAEDITMEIFSKLTSKIQKNEITFFKSWLYQVTRNECLMKLRKKQLDTKEIEESVPFDNQELSEKMEKEEMLLKLELALEQLNEEQQLCITQFYLHKKSYQEVSSEFEIPLKKVKSAIQNGKRNLLLILEQNEK